MQAEAKVAPQEIFVLTDEQILEIEPEAQDAVPGDSRSVTRGKGTGANEQGSTAANALPTKTEGNSAATHVNRLRPAETDAAAQTKSAQALRESGQIEVAVQQEPPEWLAQRMRDPWNGTEAREFWEGVRREKQETAAYREVFAKPEEARATAERARMLDEFDSAYFGAPGKAAEEMSASRGQLAQRMMREDPGAFREMVFAGLRALEDAEKPAASWRNPTVSPAAAESKNANEGAQRELAGRYATFEKAANDDLERSVGAVIDKTLQQALPNSGKTDSALKGRLNATIRQEIEKSLQGDQQLGEQVSRLLASRTFDGATRAQVVRLIGERAAQLVPSAAKRVLGDWTQTAIGAHRARAQRDEEVIPQRDLTPAEKPRSAPHNEKRVDASRVATKSRGVDYRKFSDEQILEM